MPRSSVIPFGPQHSAFLEPLHLRLDIEEEVVVGAEISYGYNHRGMEHALAQDFRRSQFLCERVCGICSFHHSSAYVQAMERLYGIEPPERAKLMRMIMMEAQRLTSHLLALGHIAETVGYENLFMQFFREREEVMMLVNRVSGGRVHYSMNAIGGLRKDVPYESLKDIESTLDRLEPRLIELQRIVRKDTTLRKRLIGVGVLSKEAAFDWCTVGPTARGSGLPHDIRLTGFDGYGVDGVRFSPISYEEGDCYARTMVRMDEVIQSVYLMRQGINLMRDGPYATTVKGNPPSADAYGRVEAPRGELMYWIRGKNEVQLDRVKLRTPALVNIPAVTAMIKGARVADVAPITISVDPCICCTDR
ncbi:MAG: nickel-dependent hydrogenase large subunit [Methanomassiliicoccales archaeon]|nr:MAG: nickel-dependent hydrogenase large subunit [Methanomassiliicoccales archaeon]